MPHVPDVRISALVVTRKCLVIGARRTGPIRDFGFEARNHARKDAAEFCEVILPHLVADIGRKRGARHPAHGTLGFVVAAPQHDAGMIAEAADLVFGLGFDVEFEAVGAGLPVVAEHEVLPDQDAEFVADLVELVGLVVASAPMADHVHVGVAGGFEDAAIVGCRDAIGEAVKRDNVGAFGEDRNAVDDELEGSAPFVGMTIEDDGAEAGLHFALIRGLRLWRC